MANEETFHLGVKALILNDKKQILILKTNPKELKKNKKIHWDLPGGRVKKGDGIEETLVKECNEELGINKIKILGHFDSLISNIKIPSGNKDLSLALIVYKCLLPKKQKIKLSFEHTEYKWASIDEAKKFLGYKYPQSFIKKLDKLF